MITYNQVRVDGGPWQKVIGLAGWTFVINTTNLTKGPHKLEAQAFDSLSGSKIVSVNFTVYDPPPPPPFKYKTRVEAFPWAVVAILAGSVLAVVILRYQKDRRDRNKVH